MDRIDKIRIRKFDSMKSQNVRIFSNSTFFEIGEYYIFKINHEKIVISRPSIEYHGKMLKACYHNNKDKPTVKFELTVDLPVGEYDFDCDESDYDKAVIYFNK